MRIKTKLSLSVVAAVSVTFLMGLVFFWSTWKCQESIVQLEIQMDKAELLAELKLTISEALMPANDYIITGKPEYLESFRKLATGVEGIYARIHKNQNFSTAEKNAVQASILAYQGLKRISFQILNSPPKTPELPALMEEMDYTFAAPAIEHIGKLNEGIHAALNESRKKVNADQLFAKQLVIAFILIISGTSLLFGITLSRSIILPLNRVTGMLQEIAEGRGNLTHRLDASAKDELGLMAFWFNRFIEGLQQIVKGITEVSHKVTTTSHSMRNSSAGVFSAAQQQMVSTETTIASVEQLHASVRAISDETKDISIFSSEAATASAEVSGELASIARQAEALEMQAEQTTSSINEIVASLQQVFASIDALAEVSERAVASGMEIIMARKEIERLVKEQAVTAHRVKDQAAEMGLRAVHQTRLGIEKIKNESEITAETAHRLDTNSQQISNIVDFISEVASQTSLLALNASILAAQAGENGRSFTVVAAEVKELAQRTSASSNQISALVAEVRCDIDATVLSAQRTRESVGEGLTLSATAEQALTEIVADAEMSQSMSKRVDIALDEQGKGLEQVIEGIQQTSAMLEEIKRATDEQRKASHLILSATDHTLTSARSIRTATANTSFAGKNLSEIIVDVASRMDNISRATKEQQMAAESIFAAIEMIRHGADQNVSLTSEFDRLANSLETDSKMLHGQIANFQT